MHATAAGLPVGAAHGFRPDIEGLRALAVGSVVLFHAHVTGIPGGFVGVDVFFVISGFLICGLLQRELAATGRIDLLEFWARRARRLLPNAGLTLLATLLATALLAPSYTFPDVARAVAAAALYGANLHFAANDLNYFADDDEPSPVLHFWSLSVEEQFYIGWPLLLVALIWLSGPRASRHAGWLLAAICLASLAWALETIRHNQPVAFYHAEMRAWQLALGGLVACYRPSLARLSPVLRGGLAWLGLAAILAAILGYSEALRYPGPWALLPTLGAALIVAGSGGGGWLSPAPLLALPPLQWLGARSYSLYLWHWPALVLAPLALPDSPLAVPAGLALGTLLAILAYELVETPMRHGRGWPLSPRLSMTAAAASIALVLAGSGLLVSPLLQGTATDARLAAKIKKAVADRGRNIKAKCNLVFDQTEQPPCVYGEATARRTVALLGDSHAAQWFEGVDKAAKAKGWRLLAWTKSACPIAEVTIWHKKLQSPFVACDAWREGVIERLTTVERPEIVLISSYVRSMGQVWDEQSQSVLTVDAGQAAWKAGLVRTIRRLQEAGIRPVLIRDTPEARKSYLACLAAGRGRACDRPRGEAFGSRSPDLQAALETGIEVLDLSNDICTARTCPMVRKGIIVFRDRHHLTASFTATLAPRFEKVLTGTQIAAGDLRP